MNSIRSRYLSIALLFVIFLLSAAWVAEVLVSEAGSTSAANMGRRQNLTSHIRDDIMEEMWVAENALAAYMLVPSPESRMVTLDNLDDILEDIPELLEFDWVTQNADVRRRLMVLTEVLKKLRERTEYVMHIRADTQLLFPALPVMLDEMQPANRDYITAATLAIDEAAAESDDRVQRENFHQFSHVRYQFAQMVGVFRLWAANRLGIFGNMEDPMRAQPDDVSRYLETLFANIGQLALRNEQGLLGITQSESVEVMKASLATWQQKFQQVYGLATSENWRTDAPVLNKEVYPLYAEAWEILYEINKEADGMFAEDVESLSNAADQATTAIWLLALIGVLVTGVGFIFFEITVRRPIAHVTSALKAEASGEGGITVPDTQTEETQDLITAFDSMRQQVNSRQQRLGTILNNAAEGIITFDERGSIESFNRAAEKLFGWHESEIIGTSIGLLVVADRRDRREGYLEHFLRNEIKRLTGTEGEVVGRHKDGSHFPAAFKVSEIVLDGKRLFTALIADISERKAIMERLKSIAEHDGLTNMYNRSYFSEELERVVDRAQRSRDNSSALLYIDLDNFKYVNDTQGHAAGDRLLVEVAQIMQRRARKSDLLARFGGDEFTVLLYDTTPEYAQHVAESYRSRLADYEFRHRGEHIHIGCSIGVNVLGPNTVTAEEALSQADFACHLAKLAGRNKVHIFSPKDAEKVNNMSLDMGWSKRIKQAIEEDRLVLAFQPIVDMRDSTIETYEVLVRMLDDDGELIYPGGFLPAAERFGQIVDIDKWVIEHAIRHLSEHRKHSPNLCYTVNLSAKTIAEPDMFALVSDSLQKSQLQPGALIFEVTETDAIADMTVAEEFLSRLQELGCRTALDDFGSGMSSFAYLKDLPVDMVKIDGYFVRNLANNPWDQAMVKAMNDIAHALGKITVAEFIEDEESFHLLREYGVDYGQGYHLGRPQETHSGGSILARKV